jgi:DNA-binding PadR family transcriptional regulator
VGSCRFHADFITSRIACTRDGLEVEDGSLYPALNRMRVKGWLAAEWGISENNRKAMQAPPCRNDALLA